MSREFFNLNDLFQISAVGHYTAVLQNQSANNFTITDDTIISEKPENFNIKGAYCLFYERLEEIPSISTHSLPSVHQIPKIEDIINSLQDDEMLPETEEAYDEAMDSDGDIGISASQPDIPFTNFNKAPIPDISEQMKKTIEELKPKEGESAKDAHERFSQHISGFSPKQVAEYILATNSEVKDELAPIPQKDKKKHENIEKLKQIHREGLKQLNLGKSNLQNLTTENPFVAAAFEFEDKLAKKFEQPEVCSICMESSYDVPIGPLTRKCPRCADEFRGAKLTGVDPKTFSKENKMIPADIPDELKGLSFAESKIIALANPLLHIYSRKGLSSLRGNCIGK